MSFTNGVLEGSGVDLEASRPRFWSLQASILEPPASILKPPGLIVEPPGLLPSFGHASHIQQHHLTNVGQSLAWGSFLFCFCLLNSLAKVWEAAVSPLGGLQSAGHRRCANSVPDSFPTGSVQSQLANLDILSSSSFAQFDLKCSFPYPFLSPGAWGPPQTRRQKAEKFGFFAFLVDFFAFRTALEK